MMVLSLSFTDGGGLELYLEVNIRLRFVIDHVGGTDRTGIGIQNFCFYLLFLVYVFMMNMISSISNNDFNNDN
jgi:hypothetical protein